ncbi:MAG TPA: glycoside hydrolase family 38 C-terminal domain-containing protein, partial [Myxococcota bacterium]|nr:glycoside hydrolase family 38 C-terminal domain-containing protein [Myxococcota bacterium]
GGALDLDAAKAELRERIAKGGFERVRVRAARVPRVRLRFDDVLPGHGLRAYRVAPGRAGGARAVYAERLAGGALRIGNATWTVDATPDGRIALLHRPSGAHVPDAIAIVSEGDRGDEYNFDPVPGAPIVDRPERARLSLTEGEGEVELTLGARYRVPLELAPDRRSRSARRVVLPARLAIRLREDGDALELAVEIDNTARDHRLRVRIAAPFAARRHRVESAFEIAERPIAPDPDAFGRHPSERPIGTSPQRRFASADDGRLALTVANRGGGEVEVTPESAERTQVLLTVLRAVGWLSRPDLALRRGDAGPALPTPGAQVPGVHRLELAVRLHAVEEPQWIAAALRFAVPALAFPGRAGAAPSASLHDGDSLVAIDDAHVLLSALEPHPDGGARVRVWNASPETRRVRVRLAAARGGLAPVDLRDAPSPRAIERKGDAVEMTLRPFEDATLRAS